MNRARAYYRLAKPGIIYGNDLSAAGGFCVAAAGSFRPALFLAMLAGISLIMGSACVFNNYIDRGIDSHMSRTKGRALVLGSIGGRSALAFGLVLLAAGSSVLGLGTNSLTLVIALAGFVVYVAVYGYFKRRSVYGTEVGSIAGAVPPVVGYTAVTGKLDTGALLLFLILVFWQMPHFYAIATFRLKDYEAAKLPVLPAVKGTGRTRMQMAVYIAAFTAACAMLSISGYTGLLFFIVSVSAGFGWLYICLNAPVGESTIPWARKVFKFSLLVLLAVCGAMAAGSLIA